MKKPEIGAVLITVLYALGGLMLLLSALVIGSVDTIQYPELLTLVNMGAGIMLIMALILFTISYGVYNMTQWGWGVAIVISGIGLIGAITAFNVVGIIILGLIVWYLWMNKSKFGM